MRIMIFPICFISIGMASVVSCVLGVQPKPGVQPKLLEEPESYYEVIQGSSVILRCAISMGNMHMQWTRNGFGLGEADLNNQLLGFPRYSIIGNAEAGQYHLKIVNSQMEDEGVYDCQTLATPTTNHLRSRLARVTILLPPTSPTIQTVDPCVEVRMDQAMNLTCRTQNAKPAAEIKWYIGDSEISSDAYYTSYQGETKMQNTTSALTLTPRKSYEEKKYTCCVKNAAMSRPLCVRTSLTCVAVNPVAYIMIGVVAALVVVILVIIVGLLIFLRCRKPDTVLSDLEMRGVSAVSREMY